MNNAPGAPSIAGTVRFASATRRPVQDAMVYLEHYDFALLRWVSDRPTMPAITATDGTFSFTDLTPGVMYHTTASPWPRYGLAPEGFNGGPDSIPFVAPADGSVTTLVHLYRGYALSGHVTVGGVSAAAGVTVKLLSPGPSYNPYDPTVIGTTVIDTTVTDESGNYVFWNVPNDVGLRTMAVGSDPDYPREFYSRPREPVGGPDPELVAPGDAGYDIDMPAGSAPTETPPTTPAGSLYANRSVERIVDTRDGTGGMTRLTAGVPVAVTRDMLRAPGVAPVAAVVQLTAVGASGPGYLTAYPCGIAAPLASSVNYVKSAAASALATVRLDAAGSFCVVSSQNTDLVIDRFATYDPPTSVWGGKFVVDSTGPTRLVDTRTPSGGGRLGAGETRTYLGPAGVRALMINLTATNSDGGWVAVNQTTSGWPSTSNLNVLPGETRSNAAVVPVDPDGSFSVHTQSATDIVIDVLGTFTDTADESAGSVFRSLAPSRVLDTRNGTAIPAGGTITVDVSAAGVPAGATAVAATLTSINSNGYLTAWSAGTRPLASNVNGSATGIVPNTVYVGLSNGTFQLFSQAGADVVIDVVGYFTAN